MKSLRKLVPAFSLLLVSAIVLSSASFAWFTMSRQVTANGMDVTVTAPNNLLIAADGSTTFDSTATLTATNISLLPASTQNGLNGGMYVLKEGSTINVADGTHILNTSAYVAGGAATADVAGAYYDFKYQVKTEGGTPVKVVLSELNITKPDAASQSDLAVAPVRVALLVKDGAYSDGETAGDVKGIFKSTGATGTKGIAATDLTAETGVLNQDPGVLTYKDLVATPESTTPEHFTVTNGTTAYVTVRVWYDGEDSNCVVSTAANAKFNVEALFKAVPNA